MDVAITLAQQPIVDPVGWVIGVEVLSRFSGTSAEALSMLAPEQIGSTIPWHVVDSIVAAYLPVVMRRSTTPGHVFLNISEQTWSKDEWFNPWVRQLHRMSQWFPGRLIVEVSEKVDVSLIQKRWSAIRSTNVLVALDDFETKHSDAQVLERFDWDFCKFNLPRLATFEDLAALDYCRNNGIYTVVERIETEQQSLFAKLAGASMMQGYLYGRPLPRYQLPIRLPSSALAGF